MSKLTIAIAGATGAVGQQMRQCLEERKIDCELRLFASHRSVGKTFSFQGKDIAVEELKEESFENVDIVLGATENDITKQWMPWAQKHHAVVIDNSSAYRLDPHVPLVIPEINPEDIKTCPTFTCCACATCSAVSKSSYFIRLSRTRSYFNFSKVLFLTNSILVSPP